MRKSIALGFAIIGLLSIPIGNFLILVPAGRAWMSPTWYWRSVMLAWSPDSQQLLFVIETGSSDYVPNSYILNHDGTDLRRLSSEESSVVLSQGFVIKNSQTASSPNGKLTATWGCSDENRSLEDCIGHLLEVYEGEELRFTIDREAISRANGFRISNAMFMVYIAVLVLLPLFSVFYFKNSLSSSSFAVWGVYAVGILVGWPLVLWYFLGISIL